MNPESPRFSVGLVGRATEQLDLRALLAAVYLQIIQALETRPREWGDPFHNYRGLDATAYSRAILPAGISVEYAVHNAQSLVWVSKLIVLEGSPFAGG